MFFPARNFTQGRFLHCFSGWKLCGNTFLRPFSVNTFTSSDKFPLSRLQGFSAITRFVDVSHPHNNNIKLELNNFFSPFSYPIQPNHRIPILEGLENDAPTFIPDFKLDSTKRKRKRKMAQHKRKKRRKLLRKSNKKKK